jgi:hypothetical protein
VEAAVRLAGEGLAAWAGRPVVLDVPGAETAFLAWLQDAGFAVQRPFTRLVLGAALPRPAGALHSFAICGPEYG